MIRKYYFINTLTRRSSATTSILFSLRFASFWNFNYCHKFSQVIILLRFIYQLSRESYAFTYFFVVSSVLVTPTVWQQKTLKQPKKVVHLEDNILWHWVYGGYDDDDYYYAFFLVPFSNITHQSIPNHLKLPVLVFVIIRFGQNKLLIIEIIFYLFIN